MGDRTVRACKNCGYSPAHRPGRLCSQCFKDPAIQARFPRKRVHVGSVGKQQEQLNDRPTAHLPGSEGKFLELCERARLGMPLHHEQDARHGDC